MSVFLIKFDPTGRMGAVGYEELTITVEPGYCSDMKRMIEPLKQIASLYSGVKIEYADIYMQLNAGE